MIPVALRETLKKRPIILSSKKLLSLFFFYAHLCVGVHICSFLLDHDMCFMWVLMSGVHPFCVAAALFFLYICPDFFMLVFTASLPAQMVLLSCTNLHFVSAGQKLPCMCIKYLFLQKVHFMQTSRACIYERKVIH